MNKNMSLLQKKLNKSEAIALMSYGAKLVHASGVYHHYYLEHNGETLQINKISARSLFSDKRIVITSRDKFHTYHELKTK